MNKDEKSLLDELWNAAGMNEKNPAQTAAGEETTEAAEQPAASTVQQEPAASAPPAEPADPAAAPPEEEPEAEKTAPAEKKKDIKFLVIYTTVFVIVISGLIGGSYLITSRIQREMSENNDTLNSSQSTLKNIQDENAALKKENAALQESNAALTVSQQDAEELLASIGDMVEQDQYLAAAQNAYIDGNRTLARTIFSTIDRDKLSEPSKPYYDLLKTKLGL